MREMKAIARWSVAAALLAVALQAQATEGVSPGSTFKVFTLSFGPLGWLYL